MYLVRFHSISNSQEYKDYLNESIKYLHKQAYAEIKKEFPDVDMATVNLDDTKYRNIVKDLPYTPKIMGNLAVSLGLDQKVMTEEIWEDLFHGYVKEEHLPESSHLRAYVEDTPKGRMLKLNNSPGRFNDKGEYEYDGLRRSTIEGVFTLGKGLSTWIVAREIEEPGIIKKVEEIHNRVMQEWVLPEMVQLSKLREVDGGEVVKSDGFELMAVSFLHLENRAVEPNIHAHVNVVNTAMSADGRLYSLDTDAIYNNKNSLSSLYMSYMKEALEEEFNIPFEKVLLEKDKEDEYLSDEEKCISSYDISKDIVPEHIVDHFSTRVKEIEAEIKKKGVANTGEARMLAQKATREEKSDLSPSELLAKWKEEFKSLGFVAKDLSNHKLPEKTQAPSKPDEQLVQNFQRKYFRDMREKLQSAITSGKNLFKRKPKGRYKGPEQKINDDALISGFINKVGVVDFRLSQFTGHMVTQLLDTCSADKAWQEAHRLAEQHCQLYIPKEREEYYRDFLEGKIKDPTQRRRIEIEYENEARFITNKVKHWSEEIHTSLMERVNEDRWLVDDKIVNRFIMEYELDKGFQLSFDQANDIRATFNQPGAVINTAGMAGAGKSTSAEVKVKIWESQGFNVWGTSVAETATKGLAESAGIRKDRCHNSAKLLVLLDEGKIQLNDKSVLIFDEAGMADLQTLHRIVMHANKAGAKMNFVGEKEQLQPISLGNSFKFLNDNFTTIPLTSINRQKKLEDRETVKYWQAGEAEKAIKRVWDQGGVLLTKKNEDSFEKVAQLYVDNPKPPTDKLIMSALNADNDRINQLVKEKLIARGELQKDPREVEVVCKDGVSRKFGKGDRITFFRRTDTDDAEAQKIDNSQTGTVSSLRKNLAGRVIAIVIDMDELDPETGKNKRHYISLERKRPAIRHGWAQTVHKAQGASKGDAYRVMTHRSTDAHMEYVAASRHKDNYTLIMSEEFLNENVKKLKHTEPTKRQYQKLEWLKEEQKVEVPEYAYSNYGQARAFLKKYIDVQMPENPTHVLDDYSDIIEAMGRYKFKKNVADYSAVEGGYSLLQSIRKEREEKVAEFQRKKEALVPVDKSGKQIKEEKKKSATAPILKFGI